MQGKPRYITLSSSAESALWEGHRNGKKATFRSRCHYILLTHQGKSINDIASIYQISRQSVVFWMNRYEASGIEALHTAKGSGRPSILCLDNESEVKAVEDIVKESPQNLHTALAKIQSELGKEMSKKTLQRFFKKRV